jgi:hypothetical protein
MPHLIKVHHIRKKVLGVRLDQAGENTNFILFMLDHLLKSFYIFSLLDPMLQLGEHAVLHCLFLF